MNHILRTSCMSFVLSISCAIPANALVLIDVVNPTPPPDFYKFNVRVVDDADLTVVIEPIVPLLPGFLLKGFVDLDYFDTVNAAVQRGRFRIIPGVSDDGDGK